MSNVLKHLTLVAAAAIGLAGCVSHSTDVPAIAGPSAFAQSVSLTATPDSISQNGSDQSTIRITVVGPNAQPISGLALRLQTVQDGNPVDFTVGGLSAKNVVTNSAGVATVVFTSPPAPPAGSHAGTCSPTGVSQTVVGSCVQIVATATNNDVFQSQSFNVQLRLVPPGIILPPVKTPKANFTFLPQTPQPGETVRFDASTSCAEVDASGACVTTSATIVSYQWDFGDGSGGSGSVASHSYAKKSLGGFVVTLTVTNSTGGAASTSAQVVVILQATAPNAVITVSPTSAPVVGQTLTFDANASTSDPAHPIVSYFWDFGDSSTSTAGAIVSHSFGAAGSYTVILAVTDDAGQRATTTKVITVS